MAKNKNDTSGGDGGISPLGRAIGQIALAIVIALLLWVGDTVHDNTVVLQSLKVKVDEFQDRYYGERDKIHNDLERLRESLKEWSK